MKSELDDDGILSNQEPAPRRGRSVLPAEGEAGTYSQCWFPLGTIDSVQPGQVVRFDFLDGHVAAFRSASGQLSVVSPYCRHYGADLCAGGTVMGEELRCPYHHWRYDLKGRCSNTGTAAPPPPTAQLFRFPVAETAGLIWIFNGEEALYPPSFLNGRDDDLELHVWKRERRLPIPPAVVLMNNLDYAHTGPVHGWTLPETPSMTCTTHGVRISPHKLLDPVDSEVQTIEIFLFGLSAQLFQVMREAPDGRRTYICNLDAFLPLPDGMFQAYSVFGVTKDASRTPSQTRQLFEKLVAYKRKTTDEDAPILQNIRFRWDCAIRSDDLVAQFLKYASGYPRTHPSQDFIR